MPTWKSWRSGTQPRNSVHPSATLAAPDRRRPAVRRGADRERIRPELVFGPLAVLGIRDRRGPQSDHAFVEFTGAFHVRHGVTTKGEFSDFEH